MVSSRYQKKLKILQKRHQQLKNEIANKIKQKVVSCFDVQKLKKKKIQAKEEILRLRRSCGDDIIA